MTRVATTKSELRRVFRERRAALSPADLARSSREICDRFFGSIDLTHLKVLSTFIRIPRLNEIDTSVIYYRLWRDHPHITTVAASIDLETGAIESVEFVAKSELVENKLGIREPLGTSTPADEVDLVLVPLLCFDRRGDRVGYGRGFYDRFLIECRDDCMKVGLSCFSPVDAIEDSTDADIKLDVCITPDQVFQF
jgi:5-formyltetrahydrofolate cyclo-ligase